MIKCNQCNRYFDENINRRCPYCTGGRGNSAFSHRSHTNTHRREPERTEVYNASTNNQDNRTISIVKKNVVAWIVIISGIGEGRDFRVVTGQNTIGKSNSNMIAIDFGDDTISREKHAFIIYDSQNNKFIFRGGEGQNISYLNGNSVYSPVIIKNGDIIEMGETKFRFSTFCDETFIWEEKEETTD